MTQVQLVSLEQPDSLDQLEAKDLKVLTVSRECQVLLDSKEEQANKEPPEVLDPRDNKVLWGPPVQLVQLAVPDHQDSKATQVHKELLAILGPKEELVTKVSKVQLVHLDQLETRDLLVLRVLQDLLATRDHRVSLD